MNHKTVGAARTRLTAGGEIPHVTTVSGGDGKTYGLPSRSVSGEFNATDEAAKVLQYLEHRAKSWSDEHRPELAKAIRSFAGELMSGNPEE